MHMQKRVIYDNGKIVLREKENVWILYELDSTTRHCNYGRPLASFRIDRLAARFPARWAKLVSIFTCIVHRAHMHCRFERHEISSITLSLCLILCFAFDGTYVGGNNGE